MDAHHLVTMANDIARFFDAEMGADKAHAGVATHISRFWDPRMRQAITAFVKGGGEGLLPSAEAAVKSLPAP